jgi:hypothetical protein
MKDARYPEFKYYWNKKERDKVIDEIRMILAK